MREHSAYTEAEVINWTPARVAEYLRDIGWKVAIVRFSRNKKYLEKFCWAWTKPLYS
jgi:hypothetical protein